MPGGAAQRKNTTSTGNNNGKGKKKIEDHSNNKTNKGKKESTPLTILRRLSSHSVGSLWPSERDVTDGVVRRKAGGMAATAEVARRQRWGHTERW